MPHYHVRFLKGPNMTLRLYHDSIETAESFEQVLRRHTTWPIQISWDHLAATAWNPGTSMYYQEMWEAALLTEDQHLPLIGAWKQGEAGKDGKEQTENEPRPFCRERLPRGEGLPLRRSLQSPGAHCAACPGIPLCLRLS